MFAYLFGSNLFTFINGTLGLKAMEFSNPTHFSFKSISEISLCTRADEQNGSSYMLPVSL